MDTKTINIIKWTAASPWLLLLLVIVNGGMFGGEALNLFGISLSLFTVIPFVIFYFVNRDHEQHFIKEHTRHAMNVFLIFVAVVVCTIVMALAFGGFAHFEVSLTGALFGSSFTVYLVLMILAAVVYAVVSAMIGAIRAFTFIYPDKCAWMPHEEPASRPVAARQDDIEPAPLMATAIVEE